MRLSPSITIEGASMVVVSIPNEGKISTPVGKKQQVTGSFESLDGGSPDKRGV